MRRTLEEIFRHKLALLLILLIPPLISAVVVYFLPYTYRTTASLWALRRYEVIGSTGVESNLEATPATTQVTALNELLHTRAVALNIARNTNVAATLNLPQDVLSTPSRLDDALYEEITQNVEVKAQGYNMFTVSYANRDPQIAQKVVQAVLQNFSSQSQVLIIAEAQKLLENYKKLLHDAQNELKSAADVEAKFLADHPDLTQDVLRTNPDYASLSNPQYALLHSQTKQAQAKVENIQNSIADLQRQLSSQGKDTDTIFSVIDPPKVPQYHESRTRLYLIAAGVALGLALVSCVIYIVILYRRNRAIYTAQDLHKMSNLPVLMQVPQLAAKAIPVALEQTR
uniref:Polysaccharide chain length determinant N-terminal domain-containing protein n=1 Tax=Thermosporothrix sp. COM3 TaxID=2490863 RepID=A0A455SQG2_9CHLR|nr:hypothetical protein KTC_31760 [Thermosporothrix sp. COM3]